MENQVTPEKDIDNIQSSEVVQKGSRKYSRWIALIFLLIFFLGLVGLNFFSKQNKRYDEKSQNKAVVVSFQPSKTTQIRNKFETDKTKIANSLDVPPLYPSVKWEEVTRDSKDKINKANFYEDLKDVAFAKGHIWKSKTPAEFLRVEEYYSNELLKKNWTELGTYENLEFRAFGLVNIIADGVCGGIQGSLGYKDGFVRLIAIRREIKPCIPQRLSILSPYPSDVNSFMFYEVFMSDPTPIEEIAKYVKPGLSYMY